MEQVNMRRLLTQSSSGEQQFSKSSSTHFEMCVSSKHMAFKNKDYTGDYPESNLL